MIVGHRGGFLWSVPESSDGTKSVEFPWSRLPVQHPVCTGTMTMFKGQSCRALHTTVLTSESTKAVPKTACYHLVISCLSSTLKCNNCGFDLVLLGYDNTETEKCELGNIYRMFCAPTTIIDPSTLS